MAFARSGARDRIFGTDIRGCPDTEPPGAGLPSIRAEAVGTPSDATAATEGSQVSETENKALVRRLVEEWQSGHQPDVAREILADDFADWGGHVEHGAKEAAIGWFSYMWRAFPDFSVTIKLQIAEGDMVATLKTFSGTHQGEFMGIAPTGRHVAFDVFDMLRVRDGQVVEHWMVQDDAALMKQLGGSASLA
jgi:predicted ester cyclase